MTRKRRLVSSASLAAFSTLVLGYLWWGRFQYDHYWLLAATYAGAASLLIFNHLYHRDTRADMGFRLDNFLAGSRTWGTLTLFAATGTLILGGLFGSFRLDRLSDVYLYFIWAAVQQHLLQNFLRLRSKELLGGRTVPAAVLAAALFGVYHLPNVTLALASLAGGLLWCLLFFRLPNFIWSWLSQAVLVTLLMFFMKYSLLGQFEVGKPGYRYDYYGQGVKVAGGYGEKGNPIIVTLPGPDRGTSSRIRVFDPAGRQLNEWVAFPEFGYSGEFAVGDLGFGPGDEIVVAPGPGGRNPQWIRIFDQTGRLLKEHRLENGSYGAWVSVACGQILYAPGPGPDSPLEVRAIDPLGGIRDTWNFERLGWFNGIRASGLCDGDRHLSFLALWASPIAVNPSSVVIYDIASGSSRSMETLGTTFGVNVTTVRLGEGRVGVVAAPGPLRGYPPIVQVIELDGKKFREFAVESDREAHGCNVGAVDVDADGIDEILVGEGVGPGRPARVRLVRVTGAPLKEWIAY